MTHTEMNLIFLPVTSDMEFDCSNYEAVSGVMMDAIESTLALQNPPPWSGYLAVTEKKEVVGICAFKEAPNEQGEVELAWFTFPPYERRGHGTRMAAELVRIATEGPYQVTRLVAHTEPAHNASTRICEKNGFALQGQVELPDDGPVWLWTREVS